MKSKQSKVTRKRAMTMLRNGEITQQQFDWLVNMGLVSGKRTFSSRKIETKTGDLASLKKPGFVIGKKHVKKNNWTAEMTEFVTKVEKLFEEYSSVVNTELKYS